MHCHIRIRFDLLEISLVGHHLWERIKHRVQSRVHCKKRILNHLLLILLKMLHLLHLLWWRKTTLDVSVLHLRSNTLLLFLFLRILFYIFFMALIFLHDIHKVRIRERKVSLLFIFFAFNRLSMYLSLFFYFFSQQRLIKIFLCFLIFLLLF